MYNQKKKKFLKITYPCRPAEGYIYFNNFRCLALFDLSMRDVDLVEVNGCCKPDINTRGGSQIVSH